jgi:hypothetical protein
MISNLHTHDTDYALAAHAAGCDGAMRKHPWSAKPCWQRKASWFLPM